MFVTSARETKIEYQDKNVKVCEIVLVVDLIFIGAIGLWEGSWIIKTRSNILV